MAIIRDYTVTYEHTPSYEIARVEATSKTQSSYAALPTLAECRTALGIGSIQEISLNTCFRGCTSLTTVPTIPNNVTDMSYCLYGCTSLTTVPTIPNNVTNMSDCFLGCTSLTTVPTMPNNVTNMQSCFRGCTTLTTVPTIPASVTNMSSCFSGCTSLTTAPTIPNNVTYMASCFYGCTSLTTVQNIPSGASDMAYCFKDCVLLETVPTIPASVVDMPECFSGCTSLQTAPTISNGVINLNSAFYGCTSLTGYITIPASVVRYNNIFDNTSQVIFVEGGSNATAIASAYSNVHLPKWNLTHIVNDVIPNFNAQGKAMIQVLALKISDNTYYEITNTNGWAITQISENSWRVVVPVGKDYVVDKYSVSTTATIKIEYDTVETYNPQSQKAFFATSRTANFSNGLANSMFVSGCSLTAYSSKVWYSKVNNPLYFPDTNYIEVGSNDKSIMGLMKIGEYLGIVKQGSTTDTSVYLAYPTTYNDDTTYAVQQEINGIGASAKYCFNVLNDEALFLSKDGVMAINPSGDDENKIRNRSFFVNKRLLAEDSIGFAYSFVWRNLYILAINNHCYVLDGNQKSSWVNEKTNLQYEAYYWDNVPADCFVKCNERLWFSDGENLCRFKDDTETNAYMDNGVAVSAEWSTILDDDGSVHYFKTMQKKGNIVSLLPCGDTSADVYIKADNENPVLIGTVSGSGNLPTEMYINKKFKKYKRLQFIVKNELDQGFGIDSIIKNYTVGNYSKNRG